METAHQVAKKLMENNVDISLQSFMRGFWGTRISFPKKDKRKVQRLIPDCRLLKDMKDKQRLCLEYYG